MRLIVFGLLSLALLGTGLLSGCSVKPTRESGRAGIVLETHDRNLDLIANVGAIRDVTGDEITISLADQDEGYITVPEGRYRIQVYCRWQKRSKRRDLNIVTDSYWLRSGVLLRMRFNKERWKANDQRCPLEFYLAES